ncbi:HNH endonuclease [Microbacterium sp. WCS2018Hpa-9]|uniref:HNH endonuclease signature motif containing protein n=1 Tax=Microbacterium sp. WCS2018Hpa-9 TaxID=3073635 RepID=UPI00288BD416|nr:HNH endonuclease [Microbacterium sp. WCS2018Hpa-9]
MREYYLRHREEAIEKARAVYAENREEIRAARKHRYANRSSDEVLQRLAYNREYYASGREWHLARNAEWRAANPDRCRELARSWAERNPDRLLARRRKYAADNAERRALKLREWHESNPDKVRAGRWRRKALMRNAPTLPFSASELASRLDYYGRKCWMCRGPYEHLDHVKPLSRGGAHVLANLRPACASCNLSKKDKWFGVSELARFKSESRRA